MAMKCDKPHISECPDYDEATKKCPRGNKCPLVHRNKSRSKKFKVSNPVNATSTVRKENTEEVNFLDFKASYISIQQSSNNQPELEIAEKTKGFLFYLNFYSLGILQIFFLI